MKEEKVEELGSLISQYGWSYSFNQPCTFETGWQTKSKKFKLLITGNDSFICFSVCIFKLYKPLFDKQDEILNILNNFNNRTYFVKTYYTSEREFLLCADVFNQNKIKYNDFRLTLSILTYYSHHLYREISKIINLSKMNSN